MTVELNNDQKIVIVNQHLANLAYTQYNVQLSIAEANAVSSPEQNQIDALNRQLSDVNAQIAVLNTELASLTPSTPAAPAATPAK